MFVIRDGRKVAKRDQQAKAWISLEPGWQVFDAHGGGPVQIVYRGMRVQ
jgi:hypothetical protein